MRRWIALTMLIGCGSSPAAPEAPVPAAPAVDIDDAAPANADEILQAHLRDAASRHAAILATRPRRAGSDGAPAVGAATPSSVHGRLPPEEIQRVVRSEFGRFRLCYENELRNDPEIEGRLTVTFTIVHDGSVSDVAVTSAELPPSMLGCVERAFTGLRFPAPVGGVVEVSYPVVFSAGSDKPAPRTAPVAAPVPPPLAAVSDPEGPWPIVVIEGSDIRFGGTFVGDASAIARLGRPAKVDELFEAAKAHREAWKARHPGEPHPGIAGLRVAADVPAAAFKSVFQTLAYAGFPNIHVQAASEPSVIVAMGAQVPGPPLEKSVEPSPAVHVHSRPGEHQLVWKLGATVIAEYEVANEAELGPTLCRTRATHARKRAADDRVRDELIVHVDNALHAGDAMRAARAAEACTEAGAPAFWVTFSVR
jgi:hypothetical protein